MRERRPRLIAAIAGIALLSLILGPRHLRAQAGTGHLEDASIAPGGLLRVRAITVWTRYDSRFTPTGVEPLGASYTSDSLGSARVAALGDIESLVQSATGSAFALSLGNSRLDANGREEIVPVGLEYGLTSRVSIGVVVPIVRRRVAVQFRMDSAGANVGPNLQRTSSGARQINTLVQTEFANAASQLQQRIAQCKSATPPADCAALLARETEAQQLIDASQGFATTLAALYGGGTSSGMAFVPIASSAAQTEIELRVADFNTRYRDLLGASADLIRAIPAAAGGPAGPSQFQSYLTGELGRDSLAAQERSGFGDVEIGIKALLVDRPVSDRRRIGAQLSLHAAIRLPTSSQQSPSELADLRLGDGPMIDARAALDLQAGRAGLLAVGDLSYVNDGTELARNSRWFGVHLAPRWHLSAPLSLHGAYSLRKADYSGATQFVGGGVSFSTLPGYRATGGVLPMEMRFTHLEALSAESGQPKYFRDQIEVRLYFRLFKRY